MANNGYVITPDSQIILLKCPLEMDSKHQLSFSSVYTQYDYFYNLPHKVMLNATYQRKDGRLYFEGSFDECLTYNYCMYRNVTYQDKWFYAFVTDIRFESNNSCSCQLKTDVFQTWQFDYTIKKSFIERSHVAKNTDTVGAYTVPEGLETGEYVTYLHWVDTLKPANSVIMACTLDYQNPLFTQTNLLQWSDTYNGLFAGCGYYKYMSTSLGQLMSDIKYLNGLGQIDSIICLFMYPSAWTSTGTGTYVNKVNGSSTPYTEDYGIPKITTLDGYTPKNNKLLTYPYCYIMASNGVGTANIYKQELWSVDNDSTHTTTYNKMVMRLWSVLCPGGSVKVTPINYNGCAINVDEGFSLGKYPQLSFPVDLYTNWEVQNGTNIFGTQLTATETGYVGAAIRGVSNLLTGNLVGSADALGQAFGTMQEQYRHSLIPPTIGGNINNGDVSAVSGLMAFQYQKCGIKAEFARNIDNYFEMFGYKLNKVDTINTSSRSNWNFIKTIDVNMTGNIPERDLQELKDLYNGGFTIWHTTTYFMDYSQTNS